LGRFPQLRVVGQAQVVVGGQVDDLTAVDDDARLLRPLQHPGQAEDAVALQLLDLVEQEVQRRTGPLRHLIHSFARHGCSTTLPQRPSMSVLNACAKSSMAKRCVMTGVTSSPPCNSRVIW